MNIAASLDERSEPRRRQWPSEPVSRLLARRPDLSDVPGAGVRFVAAVAESA